jgi:hypothetical protein
LTERPRIVVPSKSKRLDASEIATFYAARELGAEVLQSINELKADNSKIVVFTAAAAREATANEMKADYDFSKMKSRLNPYAYGLKS